MNLVIFVVIINCNLFNFVHLDCGCNKLNRDQYEHDNKQYSMQDKPMIEEAEIENMSIIPGGLYKIGCEKAIFPVDNESPEKTVKIDDFYMDKYEVSNKAFQKFVQETSYITEAEKFNDSFVFQLHLSDDIKNAHLDFRVVNALWWYKIPGTNWKFPFGPGSNLDDFWDHPVVHISYTDAVNYCKWMGKRLPSEAEWEIACRGGKKSKLFPWGNKLMPKDMHAMNIWQGEFPDKNTNQDGFSGTNPVTEFRQNSYDMHNIVGNVWEWTSDLWKIDDNSNNPNRVKKGGSYLCHESYCYRYRCAARSQNTEDSSAGNLGFRCARNVD